MRDAETTGRNSYNPKQRFRHYLKPTKLTKAQRRKIAADKRAGAGKTHEEVRDQMIREYRARTQQAPPPERPSWTSRPPVLTSHGQREGPRFRATVDPNLTPPWENEPAQVRTSAPDQLLDLPFC